ncbi:hypothetical protein ACWENO_27055 [Streptomyces sp. NPDC004436]
MARHPEPTRLSSGPAIRAPGGTAEGEELLPALITLFTALASAIQPGTEPLTPAVEPWQVRHAGRFRRYGRPAPGVWTAETFGCPACGGKTGPWTVTCDWRVISLGCPCGVVTHEHGLAFSEVWLLLADV